MNKKIKQIPAYEQIFEYMRNAIKDNQWKIGEKIPSEIELSNEFGVNRLTVRMALQRLNSMGLVKIRTGDGTYVKQFNFRDYINNITDFYMTPALITKVTAFRRAVELECAKLAIQEASEEEIEELGVICKEYQELKQRILEFHSQSSFTFSGLVEKDVEFHAKICAMSHNELFVYAFDVAREPIYQHISTLLNSRIDNWLKKGLDVHRWNDLHKEIYEAIANRDYATCKDAYLNMIDFNVDL